MDEDVQGLVLTPFRDVVEKAKEALGNAKDAGLEPMQKAAEKLIKEGERALKKIEPLCKKHLDEYGPNFTDALKESDELAAFRNELIDALWEFDDFIEADEFDADKFTELQSLSRKAAPKIYDILMRMKLEHPHLEPEPSITSFGSGHSRVVSRAGTRHTPDISTISLASPHDEGPADMPPYPTHGDEEPPVMSNQAGPDLGLEVPPSQLRRQRSTDSPIPELRAADSVRSDEVPPKPPVNPWEPTIHTVVPSEVRHTALDSEVAPPEPPSYSWIEEIVSPISPAGGRLPPYRRPSRQDDEVDESTPREVLSSPSRGSIHSPGGSGGPGFLVGPRSPGGGVVIAPETTASPLNIRPPPVTLTMAEKPPGTVNIQARSPVARSPVPHSQRNSRGSSTNESVFDARGRESAASPVADYRVSVGPDHSPSPASRDSFHSVNEQPSPPAAVMASWSNPAPHPPPYPASFQPNLPSVPQEEASPAQQCTPPPGLEHVAPPQIDDGLIPIETSSSQQGASQHGSDRSADCSIALNSSYYQYKGFCEGAKEVIRGGLGVKKIKKPGFGAGNHVVAKCKSCLYELDWRLVEADLNNDDNASYQTVGVGFRLRFLSKSHLAAKHVDDHLYSCLFCVQLGRTTEESDATVFFTQKQLFNHLSRHSRPLPQVAGLTVIEGTTVPPQFQNNYDLHFCSPPTKSVMTGISREICAMPSAIATDNFRALNGTLRAPPGLAREPVLQFAAGARIVGIEFPARFNGEWAIGWTDNMRAAFPLDCVRLDAPLKSHIRMQPASNLCAIARWGRKPKDKERELGEWLKFDKGDVITAIGYAHTEHWCWSGYNAKGKWGIFPQGFIEPNTLREMPGANRASLLSYEARNGVFSRIAMRKYKQNSSGASGGDVAQGRPAIS